MIVKVETISEAQRTGWNLAASNLSDAAQVHQYLPTSSTFLLSHVMLAQVALLVNLLGLAMKLTGLKPMDSVSQVANLHVLQL